MGSCEGSSYVLIDTHGLVWRFVGCPYGYTWARVEVRRMSLWIPMGSCDGSSDVLIDTYVLMCRFVGCLYGYPWARVMVRRMSLLIPMYSCEGSSDVLMDTHGLVCRFVGCPYGYPWARVKVRQMSLWIPMGSCVGFSLYKYNQCCWKLRTVILTLIFWGSILAFELNASRPKIKVQCTYNARYIPECCCVCCM